MQVGGVSSYPGLVAHPYLPAGLTNGLEGEAAPLRPPEPRRRCASESSISSSSSSGNGGALGGAE